jgi:hypothetical protein
MIANRGLTRIATDQTGGPKTMRRQSVPLLHISDISLEECRVAVTRTDHSTNTPKGRMAGYAISHSRATFVIIAASDFPPINCATG